MNTVITIVYILFYSQNVIGRDFYMGIFRRDDFLVAQDNIFKQKRPYSYVRADYGRLFKCQISYFRVVDRLGIAGGPSVKIMRGGLNKKYIAVRINSQYNLPISVNVYVGCHNPRPRLPLRPNRTATKMTTIGHGKKKDKKRNNATTTISVANSQTQTDSVTKTKELELHSQTTTGVDGKPGTDAPASVPGPDDGAGSNDGAVSGDPTQTDSITETKELDSQTTTDVDGKPGTASSASVPDPTITDNNNGNVSDDSTTATSPS